MTLNTSVVTLYRMSTMTQQLKRIAVSEENYRKLKKLGEAGDSFNDVVTGLLEEHERERRRK